MAATSPKGPVNIHTRRRFPGASKQITCIAPEDAHNLRRGAVPRSSAATANGAGRGSGSNSLRISMGQQGTMLWMNLAGIYTLKEKGPSSNIGHYYHLMPPSGSSVGMESVCTSNPLEWFDTTNPSWGYPQKKVERSPSSSILPSQVP